MSGKDAHDPFRVPVEDPSIAQASGAPSHPPNKHAIVVSVSGMIAAILLAVLVVVPAPYVIESSGPTFDVFDGDDIGTTLVTIEGATTYPPSGELRLTTIAKTRASDTPASLGSVVRAWLDPDVTVYPDFPQSQAYTEDVAQEWLTSQEMATVAALGELGIAVPASIRIAEFSEMSQATDALRVDDVIVSANGEEIVTLPDLSAVLAALTPGDSVTLVVNRAGEPVSATFPTIRGEDGGALMGVWIDPTFEMPYKVVVDDIGVGGPSAGLIFTLAIIDLLTPEDELAGANVAGTGTISPSGDVGPIGGIALKMIGARNSHADWFLAPEGNCAEVVGHVPDGLRVVSVANLSDAYDAIVAIGNGTADDLATCS
jgi:PDZ domain-containing protein